MYRGYQYVPAWVFCLRGLGVLTRFGILVAFLTLAIQLAIPVAQIWHLALEHGSTTLLSADHHSDQLATHRFQFEPHRHHEFDDGIECPTCQAFVYTQDVAHVKTQIATQTGKPVDRLPLTQLITCQSFLYTSAPRAPPVVA